MTARYSIDLRRSLRVSSFSFIVRKSNRARVKLERHMTQLAEQFVFV